MERQIITVDIAPGYNKVERLKSSQGDIGRPLGVYITQNGTALDCSAYTADLYILKPDGNFFTGTATVDATEHNLITWETAKQETPVAGDCAAQIRILNNGDDIGTARFVEYVEASPGFCGEASESVVESLKEYVRQAAASAETASGAASSASGSASAARGSASAAASSASAAAGSASTAHTDAETASQAAQTAQNVAASIPEDYSTLSDDVTGLKSAFEPMEEKINDPVTGLDTKAPAIYETASGDVASFADGADDMPLKSCVVSVEPVQDLHGYDNPWPAGGGKNLLPLSVFNADIFTINDDGSVTQTGNDVRSESSMLTFPLKAGTYTLSMSETTGVHNLYYSDNGSWVQLVPPTVEKTKTFTLESDQNIYIKASVGGTYPITMKIQIESGSTATAWSPYSNICPISGWTGANVTRCGKNFVSDSMFTDNKLINASGNTNDSSVTKATLDYIPLFAGSFTLSYSYTELSHTNSCYIAYYDISKTCIGATSYGRDNAFIPFTTPQGTCFIRLGVDKLATNIQVELGSTATAYEPYQGQIYEVAFPSEAGTVYGGMLDVASGKLVVDRICHTYEGGLDSVIKSKGIQTSSVTGEKWLVVRAPNYPHVTSDNGTVGMNLIKPMCSCLKISTFLGLEHVDVYNVFVTQGNWTPASALKIEGLSTEAEYDAWCAEHKPQISWLLANAITIQLDPTEITTLFGINNVFADCGDTAIEYPADTKLYIDKKIAELQALILENNG
jgi:hypothetical protein